MAFYARNFSFNNVSSQNYSLTITSDSAEESSNFPGDTKIYTEKIFRRSDEYLLGTEIAPVLEYPVKFLTTDLEELTAQDLRSIGKWLFGKRQYGKLQIMQYDMSDVIYDCFLTNPKIIRIGNLVRGVSAICHCRSAFGYTSPKSYTYTTSFRHNNASDDTGYTYPITIITADVFGGDITITNTTDNSRQTIFTGLSANEILTIDNSLQIVTSSTGLRRLSNFNKKFFRLMNGVNNITLSGAIASMKLTYADARKIGG